MDEGTYSLGIFKSSKAIERMYRKHFGTYKPIKNTSVWTVYTMRDEFCLPELHCFLGDWRLSRVEMR